MKILLVDTYYDEFLKGFYKANTKLKNASYDQLHQALTATEFGTAHYYSKHLKNYGFDARDIYFNDKFLQTKWAKEHGLSRWTDIFDGIRIPFTKIGYYSHWQNRILREQIADFRPDIIYCHNLQQPGAQFLKQIKKEFKSKIVGQVAFTLKFEKPALSVYDLIISSFPHYVRRFRKMGIKSEYLAWCFEPAIIKKLKRSKKQYPVSFVGSFSRHRDNRLLVEAASDFWGQGVSYQNYPPEILSKYHSRNAFGMEMFNILYNSKITLNRHIAAAENHANNMRLYEATGVGTFLLTDYKSDLAKFFIPGKEVETYKNAQELNDKVNYYLSHPKQREKIAKAGQRKTLKEHSYKVRMRQLSKILKKLTDK